MLRIIGCGGIFFILFHSLVFAQSPPAELIHYTVDGKENSKLLAPNFTLSSVWFAIGKASSGNIYIANSNHIHSGGNAAIFKYVPGTTAMTFVNDIQAVSKSVNNWMKNESQFKVHTKLLEHADGKMYFFTLDYYPSTFSRGSHLYYLDPATDAIVDYSKTQPFVMKKDFSVIPNTGALSDTSGVFIQYWGVRGMSLNKRVPDLIYAKTYNVIDTVNRTTFSNIIQYNLKNGDMKIVGSEQGLGYTDNKGNLYLTSYDQQTDYVDLIKYDILQDTLITIANDFIKAIVEDKNGKLKYFNKSFGHSAPTAGGDTVYFISDAGTNHGISHLFRLICSTDTFEELTTLCGTYKWKLFNLTLSADGKILYYVSTRSDINKDKAVYSIDLTKNPPLCTRHYSISSVIEDRNLAFGGINVWDNDNNFYIPVFTDGRERNALLKVNTDGLHLPISHEAAAELRNVRGPLISPNPFEYYTEIEFSLPEPEHVELAIYDLQGRKIITLYNGSLDDNKTYVFSWNGTTIQGTSVSSGVYLATLNGVTLGKVFYKNN